MPLFGTNIGDKMGAVGNSNIASGFDTSVKFGETGENKISGKLASGVMKSISCSRRAQLCFTWPDEITAGWKNSPEKLSGSQINRRPGVAQSV
jgi:hypothetical protein